MFLCFSSMIEDGKIFTYVAMSVPEGIKSFELGVTSMKVKM